MGVNVSLSENVISPPPPLKAAAGGERVDCLAGERGKGRDPFQRSSPHPAHLNQLRWRRTIPSMEFNKCQKKVFKKSVNELSAKSFFF